MNQVFNLQRFTLLVKRNWADNKKRYVLSIIAFIGLLFLWFMFIQMVDKRRVYNDVFQRQTYFFCLFFGGAIYASQFFRDLGSKPKGINYLMAPASILEKFLNGLLYSIVLLFIVLTLVFYFVDVTMIYIFNKINVSMGYASSRSNVANVFIVKEHNKNIVLYLLLAFVSIQSFFLLGSVYFKRYSFIKTIIALFILFFLFISWMGYFHSKIVPGNFTDGFSKYEVYTNHIIQLEVPVWFSDVLFNLLKYGVPLVLWYATYFRLKEKEI